MVMWKAVWFEERFVCRDKSWSGRQHSEPQEEGQQGPRECDWTMEQMSEHVAEPYSTDSADSLWPNWRHPWRGQTRQMLLKLISR